MACFNLEGSVCACKTFGLILDIVSDPIRYFATKLVCTANEASRLEFQTIKPSFLVSRLPLTNGLPVCSWDSVRACSSNLDMPVCQGITPKVPEGFGLQRSRQSYLNIFVHLYARKTLVYFEWWLLILRHYFEENIRVLLAIHRPVSSSLWPVVLANIRWKHRRWADNAIVKRKRLRIVESRYTHGTDR